MNPERYKLFKIVNQIWNQNDLSMNSLSHIRGQGKFRDETRWIRIGEDNLDKYKTLCILTGYSTNIKAMAEWGPGGGANAIIFKDYAQTFYGIDISSKNLSECENQLKGIYSGFRGVLIDIAKPEQVLSKIKEPVDFFLSTSVYQHFPDQSYGIEVTKLAYQLLTNNGIALIQIRYKRFAENKIEEAKLLARDYPAHLCHFTTYSIEDFWVCLEQIGFNVINVILEPKITYAYFLVNK